MKFRSTVLILALCLAVFGVACGGNDSTSASAVASVAVSGTAPSVGSTAQFTAVATMKDGSTQTVTNQAQWTSSTSAFATVSASGVVTAVAPGVTIVQATYLGVSGSNSITIR